jgi:hypothetical protein
MTLEETNKAKMDSLFIKDENGIIHDKRLEEKSNDHENRLRVLESLYTQLKKAAGL